MATSFLRPIDGIPVTGRDGTATAAMMSSKDLKKQNQTVNIRVLTRAKDAFRGDFWEPMIRQPRLHPAHARMTCIDWLMVETAHCKRPGRFPKTDISPLTVVYETENVTTSSRGAVTVGSESLGHGSRLGAVNDNGGSLRKFQKTQ
ncbi:hypothetical protein DFH09DRAFT_1091171 [Mycena vulgaris]|nr:hypothetical protein DFH09DRAFT_1091171 [Mycena vulgaris]